MVHSASVVLGFGARHTSNSLNNPGPLKDCVFVSYQLPSSSPAHIRPKMYFMIFNKLDMSFDFIEVQIEKK